MTGTSIGERCSLDGRVALVTGANSGMGRELALGGHSVERLAATSATILGDGGAFDASRALAWDARTLRTGRPNYVGTT